MLRSQFRSRAGKRAIPVSVESGQIARGVQLTAVRGGLLEVVVVGKNDRKPQSKITVNAYKEIFSIRRPFR